jgi:pilus assembly protein FimV
VPPSVKAPEPAKPPAPAKPSAAAAVPASHAPPPAWYESPMAWWAGGGLAALALAAGGFLAWRRRRAPEALDLDLAIPATPEEAPMDVAPEMAAPEQPAPEPGPPRAEVDSDAELATRIPSNDADDLRRRYIEERFPETVNRTIVLDDADSVVKAARLFYEDGALPRAVELLQFAIEGNPGEVRFWLALFEIFRLERLSGEFAELARRFREQHGKTPAWRKVQYFGREIDPGNALYQDESFASLETIGPREAQRIAAESFDPLAENWLNAPMDFENEVLANELRKALMVQASLTEADLAPNPMPALRNIEMFNVA